MGKYCFRKNEISKVKYFSDKTFYEFSKNSIYRIYLFIYFQKIMVRNLNTESLQAENRAKHILIKQNKE